MNIKNRLLKLESINLPNNNGIDMIFIRLVTPNQLNDEINHIWSSDGDEFYRNQEETESNFEERVFHQVKNNNKDPIRIIKLFGDTSRNEQSMNC